MHTKTLIAVLGASLGIAIGYTFAYATEVALWALLVSIMCAGVCLFEGKRETTGLALSLSCCIFLFFLCIGIVRVQFETTPPPFTCTSCTFEGVITQTPTTDDAYQTLIIKISDETLFVQARVPLYPTYQAGETLALSGNVQVPKPSYPHGGERSFEYGSYLLTKNIGSEIFYPKIEVLDSEAHELAHVLMRFKESLVARINHYMSSPASVLASGMLFGDSSMGKELKQTFRASGLSHIVVLSGFNIAILISTALLLLMFVPLVLRIVFASFFVVMFLMMVGVEASVLRASLMAFIALLATLTGRSYVARQALLISFFALCMYEPYALLHDASLHLSFLATAGIVYLNEPLSLVLHRYIDHKYVRELITTTLTAYFSTLPYIMYAFGSISLYSLLANLIALPLVPLTMLMAFLTTFLSFFSGALAMIAGLVASLLGKIIIGVAHVIEALPYAYLGITISLGMMFLLYGALISLGLYLVRKKENETVRTKEGYLAEVLTY